MLRLMMSAAITVALSQGVLAQSSLRDERDIDEGLYTVGLAHEIREKCPEISARFFRAIGVLRGLERKARDRGYSEDEIRAYLKSDADKERLRARAARYMEARGFGQTKVGYCALGRSEIAQDSDIGALLRLLN